MLLELLVLVLVVLVLANALLGLWLFWLSRSLKGKVNAHIAWSRDAHGWITRSVGGPGDGTPPAKPPPDELD